MSTEAKAKYRSLIESLKNWKIWGSASAALISFAGFMLTPLRQKVFDYVWPPHPVNQYQIIAIHRPVLRGDRFLVKLHLVAESGKTLPTGIVHVSTGSTVKEVDDEESTVDINGKEPSIDLEFHFLAVSAGDAKINFDYTSPDQRNIPITPADVVIRDSSGCVPTIEDISGCWQAQWGRSFGELKIDVGADRSLRGTLTLTNPDDNGVVKGTIAGYVNGENAYLIFTSDQHDKQQHLRAVANLFEVQDHDRIVLCGIMSTSGNKPFVTEGILNPDSPAQKVCSKTNFVAFSKHQ